MKRIFQALLETVPARPREEGAENRKKKKPQSKRVKVALLKKQMNKLIKRGDLAGIKNLATEYKYLKQTEFWLRTSVRQALWQGQTGIAEYFLSEGGRLLGPSETANKVWEPILSKDDVDAFRWLWDRDQVKWLEHIDSNPYYLNYAAGSPKIVKFLETQFGVELGLVQAVDGWRKKQANWSHLEYLGIHLIAGRLYQEAKADHWPEVDRLYRQFRTSAINDVYPEAMGKGCELLWRNLIMEDRPDRVGELIRLGVVPEADKLAGLWYQAMKGGKMESLRWLSSSDTLVKQVKATWPQGPKAMPGARREEGAVESLKFLAGLGLDLGALNREGVPWIQSIRLGKTNLRWLIRNQPEVFQSKGIDGQTVWESLTQAERAWVEKARLEKALVGSPGKREGKAGAASSKPTLRL